MQVIPVTAVHRGFGTTSRRDAWWATPLAVFVGLSAFVGYATWAAFQGDHYTYGPYLSPFYSPELFGDSPHAWFGPKPAAWPAWLPFSPALLILPFPGLFRFTCYYYRGAYYKAFWADPPSCAVGEPRTRYRGEHSFPLILQNAHRFFMWVALVFIAFLVYDLVLVFPYLAMFDSAYSDHRPSLIAYLTVIVSSGLFSVYYLFIHPRTRRWAIVE